MNVGGAISKVEEDQITVKTSWEETMASTPPPMRRSAMRYRSGSIRDRIVIDVHEKETHKAARHWLIFIEPVYAGKATVFPYSVGTTRPTRLRMGPTSSSS